MRTVFAVIAILLPTWTGAQQPTVIRLQAADARLATPFTTITSIRELADGRIIVSDPQDLQLVVADFRTGRVEQISRRGAGPGEYGMAGPARPLTGDSSLVVDFMQRRWLLLDHDRVVATIPPDDPIIRRTTMGMVSGTDRLGHVVFGVSADPPEGPSVTSRKDSSTVVLVHRGTGRVDSLTKVLQRPAQRTITRNAEGRISSSSSRALRLRVGEQFLLHPDGWLAVVRIDPFRVDWRSPDGRWTLGTPLPVPVIRMSDREKQASLARTARSIAANPSSVPVPPQLVTPDDDWPEVMPPYINGEMAFSPEGHILLRRQPSADHPGIAYYAVDRRGRLAGLIELKDNERIHAAGSRWLYVIESDADDLKYIRRHPWPSVRLPG